MTVSSLNPRVVAPRRRPLCCSSSRHRRPRWASCLAQLLAPRRPVLDARVGSRGGCHEFTPASKGVPEWWGALARRGIADRTCACGRGPTSSVARSNVRRRSPYGVCNHTVIDPRPIRANHIAVLGFVAAERIAEVEDTDAGRVSRTVRSSAVPVLRTNARIRETDRPDATYVPCCEGFFADLSCPLSPLPARRRWVWRASDDQLRNPPATTRRLLVAEVPMAKPPATFGVQPLRRRDVASSSYPDSPI